MAHARITQTYALELIAARIENGQGSPTDQEIADYCGLQQTSDSRSLLADLADAGKVTIRGTGAQRQITLGRTARAPLVPAMPSTALARKANLEVDAAVKRIGDIIRRKPTELAAEVAAEALETSGRRVAAARSGTTIRPGDKAKPQPSKRRVTLDETAARVQSILARSSVTPKLVSPPAIPPGDGGEGVQDRGSRRDDPAPQPIRAPLPAPKLEMVRLPTKGARTTRNHMLSISITSDMRDALAARSARSGQSRSWEAFSLLGEALEGKVAAPPAKVRVPAHITAAAISEGAPVVAFVADLLERGFSAWQGEWSLERCA